MLCQPICPTSAATIRLHTTAAQKPSCAIVSRYLHHTPDGRLLPGPQTYLAAFGKFRSDLPGMAARMQWSADEIDPFADYRVYLKFLIEFHRAAKRRDDR
jgi:hypothetical protein